MSTTDTTPCWTDDQGRTATCCAMYGDRCAHTTACTVQVIRDDGERQTRRCTIHAPQGWLSLPTAEAAHLDAGNAWNTWAP